MKLTSLFSWPARLPNHMQIVSLCGDVLTAQGVHAEPCDSAAAPAVPSAEEEREKRNAIHSLLKEFWSFGPAEHKLWAAQNLGMGMGKVRRLCWWYWFLCTSMLA